MKAVNLTIRLTTPLWEEVVLLGGSGFITAVMRTEQARLAPAYEGPKNQRRYPTGTMRNCCWYAPGELKAMYQRKGHTHWLIPVLKKAIHEKWVHPEVVFFLQQKTGKTVRSY